MGNSLSFLDSGFNMDLVSTVMFETCSVLRKSSVKVPHKKVKDVRLNKPFNDALCAAKGLDAFLLYQLPTVHNLAMNCYS